LAAFRQDIAAFREGIAESAIALDFTKFVSLVQLTVCIFETKKTPGSCGPGVGSGDAPAYLGGIAK
jgi:hypothetical protein